MQKLFQKSIVNKPSTVQKEKLAEAKYPEERVIVLDDSFNTYQHVADCLLKVIPGMTENSLWV